MTGIMLVKYLRDYMQGVCDDRGMTNFATWDAQGDLEREGLDVFSAHHKSAQERSDLCSLYKAVQFVKGNFNPFLKEDLGDVDFASVSKAYENSSNKFVFLDIDGVLNSMNWMRVRSHDRDHIDPFTCKILNEFCLAEKASIVISSTWRILNSLEDITSKLSSKGLSIPIIGKTPRLHAPLEIDSSIHGSGLEIQLWLRDHDLSDTGIVIFDDDGDMSDLKPFLMKTDWLDGLMPVHLDIAHDIINESLLDSPYLGGVGKIEWEIDAVKLRDSRKSKL